MLIEGVDDSILVFSFITIIFLAIVIMNVIKNSFMSLFSVQQLNPQLHRDSINIIDQLRNTLSSAASSSTSTNNDENNSRRRGENSQISCPICLSNSVLPVETNCGHIFCATCVIQYWRHLTSNIFHSKMKCPMCRQQVTCLLPLYTRAEERERSNEFGETFGHINNYNRRFSGAPRNYLDYITDLPILLRHLVHELFSFNDIGLWYRIRFMLMFLIAFCYFISPLDIIPEALFGILGFLDDLFIVLMIGIYVASIYRQVIANRR